MSIHPLAAGRPTGPSSGTQSNLPDVLNQGGGLFLPGGVKAVIGAHGVVSEELTSVGAVRSGIWGDSGHIRQHGPPTGIIMVTGGVTPVFSPHVSEERVALRIKTKSRVLL